MSFVILASRLDSIINNRTIVLNVLDNYAQEVLTPVDFEDQLEADFSLFLETLECRSMFPEKVKKSFVRFKYGLFLALLVRLAIPTLYTTFRVSILGSLPDSNQINIASQMSWVNVLLEIIEESILLPLYFCLGDSIQDLRQTKNKTKTGFLVAAIVYSLFSACISILAWPLVRLMGQSEVS